MTHRRFIPGDSANRLPLGSRRYSAPERPAATPPPIKQPRLDYGSSQSAEVGYEYAGKAAERMFPDGKTTLNNALQIDLKRLNTRLNYDVDRVLLPGTRSDMWRCRLNLPYPREVTVYGEGCNKKEAEKRCSAAACLKLLDLGFINSRGKRLEQHHDITEDQKPKQLDIPMAGQVLLYEAIAHLPVCSTFPNWSSLETFYNSQKQHVQGVPLESGNAIFNLKFTSQETDPKPSDGALLPTPADNPQTTTNVILPTVLKRQFPMTQDTPIALLPCPHCMQPITLSLSHVGKLENPLAPFLPSLPEEDEEEDRKPILPLPRPPDVGSTYAPILAEIERQMKGENTVCAFTGRPYQELTDDVVEGRSQEMKGQQVEVEGRGREGGSLRSAAKRLPISQSRNALLREINTKPVVVVTGMTGSGKTTQVPQFILENYIEHTVGATCNIIVTQPRRISAITIAERVAAERSEPLGRSVGYQVRLDSMIPQKPGRVLFCTTGILLMRMRKNPFLHGVSHVIVDEVHERDINSDFLLILLREIVRAGCTVKVLLMSASVDAQLYVNYFMDRKAGIPSVPCVNVEGHCYLVTEHYLDEICNMIGWRGMTAEDQGSPDTNVELVTNVILHLVKTQAMGAVLVFLPGWDDIMGVQDLLNGRLRSEIHRYIILPCHSMLSARDQQLVFNTPSLGIRKIILATNIAESSITIDDIVYVVNTGTVKVKTFDPLKKISCLSTQWTSKASVTQRKGRAGRCQTGHAYNLFTKEQFAAMDEYQVPEMQRTPLEDLVLQAKLLNPWQKVATFLSRALNPPQSTAIYTAVNLLKDLGALDDDESLTPMGKALAELPIEPVIGRLVLLGTIFGAMDPILSIAAAMGYRDPFMTPPSKRQQADEVRSAMAAGCCSDHLLISRAYSNWRQAIDKREENNFVRESFLHRGTLNMMEGLRRQFQTHLEELGLKDFDRNNEFSSSEAMIRAVLTAGLQPNIVKQAKMLESGGSRGHGEGTRKRVRAGFKTIQDGRVFIHPSSVNCEKNFPSNWFVYYEKIKTTKVYIRDCTLIHPVTLILFAGKSLDIISEDKGRATIGLDKKNWFAFDVPINLADLLRCGRAAVAHTLSTGLRGHLGNLSPAHRQFLSGLNRFLLSNTAFTT